MSTIEEIKNECRAIIAQAHKAAPGPWSTSSRDDIGTEYGCPVRVKAGDYDVARNGTPGCFLKSEDAAFIAASRSFTPRAAKALLDLVADAEDRAIISRRARRQLAEICTLWDESK